MALSVEDRLAALRNRLKQRAKLPQYQDIEPAEAASLDEMLTRIQERTHELQTDDVNS